MERGLSSAAVAEPAAVTEGGLRRERRNSPTATKSCSTRADTAAVRWRWATPTSGHGDVEPLRLQRMGCSPGRWLHRPPPPWQEHEAIGFDALGRVVCVRQYDATGEVWLERFCSLETRPGRGRVLPGAARVRRRMTLPAELQSVMQMRLAAGKPVESERYMPPTGSCSRERYRHEGGRLARVEEDSCDDGGRARHRRQGGRLRRGRTRHGRRRRRSGGPPGRLAARGTAASGAEGGSSLRAGTPPPSGLRVRLRRVAA